MIGRAKRAYKRDDILNVIVGKLRLRGHSGVTEWRTAHFDNRKNMAVREFIHVRVVCVIARLRVQRSSGRAIAFAARAVARAARFEVRRFALRNALGAHIDLKIRRIGTGGIRGSARGGLILVEFPAGTSAGRKRNARKRDERYKSKKSKDPIFHVRYNMFSAKLISAAY
jgi:hypothetical protein